MDIYKELKRLGDNIVFLRSCRDVSAKSLSHLLGITEEQLAGLEDGNPGDYISVEIILILCRYFFISPEELFSTELTKEEI